ncbi:unnamed protein product [Enterobius vermicularis]|uniref:L27 domain-containing protein n=1 Tax=Enterobius vermicularis TaxID=51028 RepID=A0A0N4VLG4_ENTVE|nr:unnamed protein product [Enterobius vermicularis]
MGSQQISTSAQISFLDSDSKAILNGINLRLNDIDLKLSFVLELLATRLPKPVESTEQQQQQHHHHQHHNINSASQCERKSPENQQQQPQQSDHSPDVSTSSVAHAIDFTAVSPYSIATPVATTTATVSTVNNNAPSVSSRKSDKTDECKAETSRNDTGKVESDGDEEDVDDFEEDIEEV